MVQAAKNKKSDQPSMAAPADTAVTTEAQEWKAKYLRALADYQNLEKRVRQDADRMRILAGERIISELIPVIDMLALAELHLRDRGLEVALAELDAVLSKFGVARINPDNEEFDPVRMECVEVVAGKKNQVTGVILPGYIMNDKLLRPAKVKVGAGEEGV